LPRPHEEIQGFDEVRRLGWFGCFPHWEGIRLVIWQVFDGSDGSDEESVVFKEYALGQLQKWIQRTVERSPAKG